MIGYVVTSDNRVIQIGQTVYSKVDAIDVANTNLSEVIVALQKAIGFLSIDDLWACEIRTQLFERIAQYRNQIESNKSPKSVIII